ncbi:MAG TPA: hypothetical protein VGR35_22950 [Tepidisphaeraceae bacterium]|nr:hypothetical protein [Tepidisphaeraceae bacterium]
MTDRSTQLEYAAASRDFAAARMRRWIAIAIAGLLLACALLLVPRYLRHAQLLLQQRQMRSWYAPPTQVVFTNDPAQVKKLLMPPTRYQATPAGGAAYLVNDDWMNFYSPLGGGYQSSGTVFVGELQTKDGRRALLSIDMGVAAAGNRQWATMSARLVEPGTSYRSPRAVYPSAVRGDGGHIFFDPGDTLVVYAAVVDPNDPSHFTIDYALNGTRHTIDGWLDDVWMVVLESRD